MTTSTDTQIPDMLATTRTRAEQPLDRVPEAVQGARIGVRRGIAALQRMPDTTLRLLAAGSLGMAAGLRLTGARRLAILAAIAPALIVGSAIGARPHQDDHGLSGAGPGSTAPAGA
jgi:hypothetical protein